MGRKRQVLSAVHPFPPLIFTSRLLKNVPEQRRLANEFLLSISCRKESETLIELARGKVAAPMVTVTELVVLAWWMTYILLLLSPLRTDSRVPDSPCVLLCISLSLCVCVPLFFGRGCCHLDPDDGFCGIVCGSVLECQDLGSVSSSLPVACVPTLSSGFCNSIIAMSVNSCILVPFSYLSPACLLFCAYFFARPELQDTHITQERKEGKTAGGK